MQQEALLVQRFGLTYFALKSSIQSGELSQANGIAMVDLMAAIFRDYVELHVANHRTAIAAYAAEKVIDKAKAK